MKKLKVEIRADNSIHIEGYVNAVGRDSRVLPSPRGKFVEQVEPKTFERAMSSNPNVQLKLNHKRVLGSVSDKSIQLYEDNIGLHASADTSDPETVAAARKGELRGWSFGFENPIDTWEDTTSGIPRRTLRAFNLSEVSIITNKLTPCYTGTSIEVRGSEDIISETRNFDDNVEITDNTLPPEERAEMPDFSLYEREIEVINIQK